MLLEHERLHPLYEALQVHVICITFSGSDPSSHWPRYPKDVMLPDLPDDGDSSTSACVLTAVSTATAISGGGSASSEPRLKPCSTADLFSATSTMMTVG